MIKIIVMALVASLQFSAFSAEFAIETDQSKVHWKGTKVGGAHDGTVGVRSGKMTTKDGKLQSVEIVVDMTQMTNNDLSGEWRQQLLDHLKNDDFFSVDKYPTSTLKSTKVEDLGRDRYRVTADLTIKDKTETVVFEATVKEKGNTLSGKTDFTFDRTKFGIRYNSGNFFQNLGDRLIHDDVQLTVELVGKK